MRSLRILRDRSSQAFSVNLFFDRFGKLDPGPGFRSVSELRSDQNPEISHNFGHNFPTKILIRGLM
eukprot:3336503-Amphidinium_carterae.1